MMVAFKDTKITKWNLNQVIKSKQRDGKRGRLVYVHTQAHTETHTAIDQYTCYSQAKLLG